MKSNNRLTIFLRSTCRSTVHAVEKQVHPCFYLIFCIWPNAQTPCTTKSDTFNHRMLKPEGKDKIKNVSGTRQTMNWTSSQRGMSSCCAVLLNSQMFDSNVRKNLHYLLRCGASRRAECRTRSPRSLTGPKKPAWHSSPAKQEDACSPSDTYYS